MKNLVPLLNRLKEEFIFHSISVPKHDHGLEARIVCSHQYTQLTLEIDIFEDYVQVLFTDSMQTRLYIDTIRYKPCGDCLFSPEQAVEVVHTLLFICEYLQMRDFNKM